MTWSSTMFSTIFTKNNQNKTVRSQHSHINTFTNPCPPLQYDTIRTPFFLPTSRKCQSNILFKKIVFLWRQAGPGSELIMYSSMSCRGHWLPLYYSQTYYQ